MTDPEKRLKQEGRKRPKKAIYQRDPDKPGQAPRKPRELKRSHSIGLRFTKSEWALIEKNAELAGTTPTAIVRAGALELTVRAIVARAWAEEERETYRALVGGMNNLNQLAKAAHLGTALQAEAAALYATLRHLLAELVPPQAIEQNQEVL